MKRLLLVIVCAILMMVGLQAQTTFTATLAANSTWATVTWVQSGAVSAATFPGQVGYAGELPSDVHNVVINTSTGTGRTLSLDISPTSHVGSVAINSAPGVVTLSFGAITRNLVVGGDLSGGGVITMQGAGIAHSLSLYGANNSIGTLNTTAASGSVISYLALGIQSVFASTSYQNLSIGGSGIKTMANNNLTINGNLDISGSTLAFTSSAARTTSVTGSLSGTGSIDLAGGNLAHILDLKGSTNTIGSLITSVSGASVVSYTGTNQNVFGSHNYRSVTFTGNTKTLQGDVSTSGVMNLSANTVLALNGNNLALNGTTTIGNAATSTIAGDANSLLSVSGFNTAAMTLPLITGSVKNLSINKTGSTPTVTPTGLLTVGTSLDIVAGTLSTGANNTTIGADLNIGSGATFTSSTGITTVTGNITGAGALSYTAAGTLNIAGDFTLHTGSFTRSTGTVNYNGGNQTIRDVLYYNLTTSGAGTKSYTATQNLGLNLIVNAGSTLDYGSTAMAYTVPGTVTVNGTLNIGFTPSFSVNGASSVAGTLNFGSSLNVVTITGAISGAGTINMLGAGIAHQLWLSSNSSIGTFNTTSGSGSIVLYNGSNQGIFASPNYQNVKLIGSNTKTISGSSIISGYLQVDATLNFGVTPISVTVAGNLLGIGTINMSGAGLSHVLNLYGASNTISTFTTTGNLSSTVNYLANGNQTVFASGNYQNVSIGGSGIKTISNGNTTVAGTLDVSNSTLALSSAAVNIFTLSGNLSGNGTLNLPSQAHSLILGGANNNIGALTAFSTSSQTYNRAGNQQVIGSLNYTNLTLSGSGTKSLQAASNIAGTTTLAGTATFDLNGQSVEADGNITIGVGTELSINSNAILSLANTKSITSAGKISVVGTLGNLATITRKGAIGGYSIIQNNASAEFNANNYLIDYLNGGITISAGTINTTNNFSNGSFLNGTGSAYLILSTPIDLSSLPVITNTVFGVGPTYNVNRTTGAGKIIFENSSGLLAGENKDNDNGNPGTLVDWTFPGNVYYSKGNLPAGLTSSWSKTTDGSGASPASLSDGLNALIVQDGHTITLDNNGDINVLSLQVGQGASGKFVIGQNGTKRTLTIQNDLTVIAGGIVNVASGSGHDVNILSGNIINDGTFDLWGTGVAYANVQVLGNMGIQGTATPKFANLNLEINSIVALSVDLDVAQNLFMKAGSKFSDGGKTISIGANWNNQTGVPANVTCSGTAIFNGTINTISAGTTTTFNNVTFLGANAFFSATTIVNGNFLATGNVAAFSDAATTLTFNNNFQVDATAIFAAGGPIIFSSANTQSLILNGTTTFTTLTFSNGAGNAKSISGNYIASGAVILNAGATVDGAGTYTISGNLTINGVCNWSGKIIQKGSTILTTNVGGAFALGTAELFVDGNVWLGFAAPAVSCALSVNNNVTINSGYLVINTGTQLIGQPSKTLKVSTTLYARGSNNFPTGFGTYDLALTSTVNYDQNFNQTIRGGITYGNLSIASSSPGTIASSKVVDAALDVNGAFSLGASTTLDLDNFSHSFAGAVALNASAIINGTNATIVVDAPDANQTISGGTYNIKNILFDQSGATISRTKTFSAGITIFLNGNFAVANSSGAPSILLSVDLGSSAIYSLAGAGVLSLGAYTQLYTANDDFFTNVLNNFASYTFDVNSTVNYNRAGNQIVGNGVAYGNLALTGSGTKTAFGPLNIDGNFSSAAAATFDDATFTHHLAGNWALAAASYGIGSANGTIVLDGVNQFISTGNFNNLTVSNSGLADVNGDLTILGNLNVNPAGTIDFSVRNLTLKGDLSISPSGLLTQSTGTTTFSGASNQTIVSNNASSLGNFTINKPNAKGSQTVTVNSGLNVFGNTRVVIDAGVLDITNQTVNFGGHFQLDDNIIETSTTFISTGSTAKFNGSVTQWVRTLSHLPFTFNNIYFGGSGNKVFGCLNNNRTPNVLANDSLIVNGNFDINGANVNNTSGVLNAGSNVFLYGNWTNTGTFVHPGNRTVYFVGDNQIISGSDFYNIDIKGTGIKTLTGSIQVSNLLKISAATFDCSNNAIFVGGTWDNRGSGIFTPQIAKVSFIGSNGANIYTGTTTGVLAGKSFYNIDISKTAGGVALQGDFDVANDLVIAASSLTTNAFDIWLGGNFDNQGGAFLHNSNSSILTLNATGGQKTFRPTNPAALLPTDLLGIVINAPGTTYTVNSRFNINNIDFNLIAGDFILNTNTMKVNNNNRKILINGGKFHVDSASTVDFTGAGGGIDLNSGELRIIGTSAKKSTLTSSTNSFIVKQSGGLLALGHYVIENGIFNIVGGTLDATNNFSNGSFTGYTAGGASTAYINLDAQNCGNISLNNLVFNTGSISPKYNIYRTSGSGVISCLDASGPYAGSTYEKDNGLPGILINWTYPAGIFWNAGAGADKSWDNPLNWTSNTVPGATDIAYLDHKYVAAATAYQVLINGANATPLRLMMDAQGGAGNIEVIVNPTKMLIVGEDILISNNTTLTQAAPTSEISLGGNWTNSGSGIYNHNGGSVTFNGVGASNINSGGIGVGKAFNNLIINAPSTLYSLTNPTKFDGSVTITSGTLDLGLATNDITVAGNWSVDQANGGVFIHSNADVTFNGANQSINNGTFFNLITTNSGTKSVISNLRATNNFTIGANTTLNCGANDLYVGLNWLNNGTFIQTGLGTVVLDGTSAQSVDNGGVGTIFNHLTFSNAGTKTFFKNETLNGNVLINTGSGVVNISTYTITGLGAANSLTSNSTLQISGANNFPVGFESINFASSSLVHYLSNLAQTVYSTSYGNLRLGRVTAGTPSVKTAAGTLILVGGLYLDQDGETTLDMATNDASMTLTGSASIATGSKVLWGTTNSTLTHIGGNWRIDKDLTSFNHLVLGGSVNSPNTTHMEGDFTMTGNLTVKSGNDLRMVFDDNRNAAQFHKITGNGANSVIVESGGRILNTRPASDGPAIPENFANYNFDNNSTYYFWSQNGIDQTIYTGNGIQYGSIYNGNIKTLTMDGVADWKVKGTFNYSGGSTAILVDGGKNIVVGGATAYLTGYMPSSNSITFTLNGMGNQSLTDNVDNTINLAKIIFAGGGTKTIGDGNDAIVATGDWIINPNITVTSGRNIAFSGVNWTNNGIFTHSGSTVTFNGLVNQSINPGAPAANNHFNAISFVNPTTKSFILNGADINSTFAISNGTVDMGTLLFHNIAGDIVNTTGGSFLSGSANITLDGGNQSVQSPAFTVGNITIAGTGSKRPFGDWIINGNLLINSGATLNTLDSGAPAADWDIYVGGHWINNGAFLANTSKVTFNSVNSATDILAGNGNFYDVEFGDNPSVYRLLSPSSRISRSMVIGANAELTLNQNTLALGSNIASGKVFDVNGKLTVNQNAYLKINNQTSKSILNINNGGVLNVVGTTATTIATITRDATGVAGAESQINVLSGGKIAAKYYLIEWLQDAGLNCQSGSLLDANNNLSDGTWSNVRNFAGAKYLTLESTYTGDTIRNINFNYSGTPVVGTNFNLERKLALTPVVFAKVGGSMGSYKFERDEEAVTSAASGLLRWPAVTQTNWTGANGTDWHDDLNWDNGVPTSTMDAIIPIPASNNNPTISNANAVCNKLEITNGVVTLSNSKSLSISGDANIGTAALTGKLFVTSATSQINVAGSWNRGTNGFFSHGNGTVVFNSLASAININPLASHFYNVTFSGSNTDFFLNGTTAYFDGSINVQAGNLIANTNAYNHKIKGDFFNKLGAQFIPYGGAVASGIITLEGANQAVTNGVFSDLVVAGTGFKTCTGVTTINGTTTVSSGLVAQAGAPIDFRRNVTFNFGSSFNDGGENHTFGGAIWTSYGTYSGTGTIRFNGTTSAQWIAAGIFNNLTLDCANQNFYLTAQNITVRKDFTVTTNPLGIYFNSFQVINPNNSGVFSVADNKNVYVAGANNFPTGFSSYALSPSSTVIYIGASNQILAGVPYGNLTLLNSNTKTLAGNTIVQGTLSFNTSTLDVSASNYSLNVAGQWNNGGSGAFVQRQGTVTFDGAINQNITVGAANTNDFYNLAVANTGAAGSNSVIVNWPTSNLRQIFNNLSVSNGLYNANGRVQTIGGDLVASSAGMFSGGGIYTLSKVAGSAFVGANGSSFGSLVFTGNATYTALDDVTVSGAFTQNSGVFNGNGKSIFLGSNSNVITVNGIYKVGSNGKFVIGGSTSVVVGTTGRFELIGSLAGIAMVTYNPIYVGNGRYTFKVNGSIAAKYYTFEYMGVGGVELTTTSTIDATYNLSDGTFDKGSANQPLLQVNNGQSFVAPNYIANVSFPTNPTGTSNNVKKTNGAGTVEFYNATGLFAGQLYESDPASLINWTGPVKLTWNGSISTDWNTAANWTPTPLVAAFVPTGAEDVVIATAINQPILTTFGQKTANLTINSGAKIILNTPADGAQIDLDINGDLNLIGSIIPQTSADYINLSGSWTKTGTGTAVLGTVSFSGSGSSKLINNGSGSNCPFNNLTIGGSTLYQLAVNTTIDNDLNVLSGASFGTGTYTVIVRGNWNNSGTFLPNSGAVRLKATSGTKVLNNGTSIFNILDIDALGATYTLASNIIVNGNLDITNGILNVNGFMVTVGDNSGTDYFNIYGTALVNGASKINMIGSIGTPAKLTVFSAGSLQMLGADFSNRSKVYSSLGGRYDFNINSGANLDARFYSISNTTSAGLNIASGAIVSPVNNLSEGIYSNGLNGYTYISLGYDMGAVDTIRSVVFNAGAQYNITRPTGTTIYTIVDAGGAMGGYQFEADQDGLVDATAGYLHWESQQLYTWLGLTNDWNTLTNWYNNVLPNVLANVTIKPGTPFSPIIKTGSNVSINDLKINAGGQLTVANGAKLTVNGNVNNAGTFLIQNQPNAMASVITNGIFTGNAHTELTLPPERYFYMGNTVSNLLAGIYNASDVVNTFAYKYTNVYVRYTSNSSPLEVSPIVGYANKFKTTPRLITAIGPLNDGNYTLAVRADDWTLVANPYSCTLDMGVNYIASIANWAPVGQIDPNFYVPTNATPAVQYSTYNLSTGLGQNGGTKFLAPQQGFWLANRKLVIGTFAVYKTARVHDTTIKLKSASQEVDDVLRIVINNQFTSDEAVFAFRAIGSVDLTYADSQKKFASDARVANIYSVKSTKALAINCMPILENEVSIPIGYSVGASGAGLVTFQATNINAFMLGFDVWFDDIATGQSYNLRQFNEVQLEIVAGSINDRFALRFVPVAPIIRLAPLAPELTTLLESSDMAHEAGISVSSIDGKARIDIDTESSINAFITIYNESGQQVAQVKSKTKRTEVILPHNNTQVYIVRVISGEQIKAVKIIGK